MERLRAHAAYRRRQFAVRLALLNHLGPSTLLRQRRLRREYARCSEDARHEVVEEMWQDACDRLGAELRWLTPHFLEFRRGDARAHAAGLVPSVVEHVSSSLTDHKSVAYEMLADAGVPIPKLLVLDAADWNSAEEFLRRVGAPLLVKPVRGHGGNGVVGHIRSLEQLDLGLRDAGRYFPQVIVEEQVPGNAYRLTFLDGELLDIIRRPLPTVLGDGSSPVAQLMTTEYRRRIAAGGDGVGYKPLNFDLDCLFTLAHQGLNLRSVPERGREVLIKSASNFSGPEVTETVPASEVCTAVVATARLAASTMGPRLAGVDLVTTDSSLPLERTGGVVLEVNVPGLHHHYNVADRSGATRVAVPVLETMLNGGRRGS